ncbi:MAG: glycosyltransferase, partial [Acidobacteriota bacterium]
AFRENVAPPPPPFRLVHAGALDELKGQDVVVETLARLAAGGIDAHALFLGDGPARAGVEALAAARGVTARCTFAGQVEDAGARFAASHLMLLPSASEGGPLVLVEAMAAGCPVVGHDVGGSREMVADGAAGVLVPSLEPSAWEEAVRALLLDPERRARLVEAGRVAAGARRIERTIARVEEELLATLGESR